MPHPAKGTGRSFQHRCPAINSKLRLAVEDHTSPRIGCESDGQSRSSARGDPGAESISWCRARVRQAGPCNRSGKLRRERLSKARTSLDPYARCAGLRARALPMESPKRASPRGFSSSFPFSPRGTAFTRSSGAAPGFERLYVSRSWAALTPRQITERCSSSTRACSRWSARPADALLRPPISAVVPHFGMSGRTDS